LAGRFVFDKVLAVSAILKRQLVAVRSEGRTAANLEVRRNTKNQEAMKAIRVHEFGGPEQVRLRSSD
jgi:hypothetical protein